MPWFENWQNGEYTPEVHIYKSAIDKYQAVKVEIICKVHSKIADLELLKAGVKINKATLDPHKMPGQEVSTLRVLLDFSDDPFQTYTCIARQNGVEVASDSLHVR